MDLKLYPKHCSAASNYDVDIDDLSVLEDDNPGLVDTAEDEQQVGFSFDRIKMISKICDKIETIQCEDEFKQWLQSHLFKLHFLEYLAKAWLPRVQTRRTDNWHGTQRMITTAERDSSIKYTSTYPNTAGWSLSDWNMRLLLNTFTENNTHPDGILHHKMWTWTAKMNLMYQIIVIMRSCFTNSKVTRGKYGGYSLLACSPAEIKTLHQSSRGTLRLPPHMHGLGEASPAHPPEANSTVHGETILEPPRAEEVAEPTPNQDADPPAADEDPKLTANEDTETPAVNEDTEHPAKKWRLEVLPPMEDPEDHPMNDSDPHSDTANTDPETSPTPALLSWQDEILSPKERCEIQKRSETMDMQDEWWKVWLINIALADVVAAHAEQQVPGPPNPSKEETTCMADALMKMGKTPDKVKLALSQHLSRTLFIKSTDLPYSSIIWNENLTTATLDKVDEPDCLALLIPSIQTIEAFRQYQD